MDDWVHAWLAGLPMPPHGFPVDLLEAADNAAAEWLFGAEFHCLVEEWVPGRQADDVMGGVLWSGFALRGQPHRRVHPVPVLVQLLYTRPRPADMTETLAALRPMVRLTINEWVRAYNLYGDSLVVAH